MQNSGCWQGCGHCNVTVGYRGSYGQRALVGGDVCALGKEVWVSLQHLHFLRGYISSPLKSNHFLLNRGVVFKIAVIDPLDPISRFKGS